MKKYFTILAVGLIMLTSANTAKAQADYKYGIGAVVGTMDGISFKMYLSDNLALQADLAYKYTATKFSEKIPGYGRISVAVGISTFELNPNVVYKRNITDFGGASLDWYTGGGLSLGYCFGMSTLGYYVTGSAGKFGVNAIGGVELPLSSIPLSFSLDFRPGYGLVFDKDGNQSYFDWAIAASVRYTF